MFLPGANDRLLRALLRERSLAIVSPDDYDAWLGCKDPELARTYLVQQHAE
ncbi:hypothetical protein [Aeromonas taiwanensis]|uniref:hypothetical protein n=1 Tax=Aeromonas taiwanensis TaxID=633417 RepID=UPI00248D9FC5|nr:hypothetical protein [Aeromonas taiwanensis]